MYFVQCQHPTDVWVTSLLEVGRNQAQTQHCLLLERTFARTEIEVNVDAVVDCSDDAMSHVAVGNRSRA